MKRQLDEALKKLTEDEKNFIASCITHESLTEDEQMPKTKLIPCKCGGSMSKQGKPMTIYTNIYFCAACCRKLFYDRNGLVREEVNKEIIWERRY